jgi:ubiquinone/menaquinone biosynthesis C-methylase UbiE
MSQSSGLKGGGVAAFDLPTIDKVPRLRAMLAEMPRGSRAVDIGSGTGYTSLQVLDGFLITCVDAYAPNLKCVLDLACANQLDRPRLISGEATRLPLGDSTYDIALCSEVLEHLVEDELGVAEIARVLKPNGVALITVPHTGIGFTSFLEWAGIKTVHDYPGPEQHIRPGYDSTQLVALLGKHGLQVEVVDYYLKWATRAVVDLVSFAHLSYQRMRYGRRSWTWADAAAEEKSFAFTVFRTIQPLLRVSIKVDRLLFGGHAGFGIIVRARKLVDINHVR